MMRISQMAAARRAVSSAIDRLTSMTSRANSSFSFKMNSNNIDVLRAPQDFYNKLLESCQQAERRIEFATLYIGTGQLEQDLMASIQAAASRGVEVHLLSDYTRSTRGRPNASCDMAVPLVKMGGMCSYYHTPALRGWKKQLLRSPFNEVVGLQHMKIYIIDDTTIISGANLEKAYFTTRVDRCVRWLSSCLSILKAACSVRISVRLLCCELALPLDPQVFWMIIHA
eukprot:TRINITY_DN9462_c0_g1_i4.p1 TRINITY_DN9462_c0_g1~~TRINITY_DN9462_c0_g1_i4.p1  ORF type:complete len:227 (+),score=19.12 TRINITY_DN9462_c0_g1_i4:107-787(+)